jgi:linoleoyl-CoA desaturase
LPFQNVLLLGGLIAAIGFNVMHDGSHGSFSKNKWKNKLAAASLSMLGANHFMWNMKHNMLHHSFTNVDGVDDDIEIGVLNENGSNTKKILDASISTFLFLVFIYVIYVFWIFFTDYKNIFLKKLECSFKKMNLNDHIEFWVTKFIMVLFLLHYL